MNDITNTTTNCEQVARINVKMQKRQYILEILSALEIKSSFWKYTELDIFSSYVEFESNEWFSLIE